MLIDGDRLKVVNAPIARTKLGSATGQDVTLLQIALAVEVAARIAGDAALAASIKRGTVALGNGVDSGTVSGLGLPYVPIAGVATVIAPAGGLMIFATIEGNPTADGFAFLLSGATDSANYKLSYILAQ